LRRRVVVTFHLDIGSGDAPDHAIPDIALGAYVTDATVDVCAHGIYVHADHCTDAYVVDRNERFFRANDWDGACVAFDHRAVC
jgi:hypothetical protein